MQDLGLRIILIVHAIQDNGRSHGQKKLPNSGNIYELNQKRRMMSNEKKDNSKELALIKEAFAHSIDQKQAHIIRMRLELEMRNQRVFGNFYHISNGRIIDGTRNNFASIDEIKDQIAFLKDCYDRAEELRIKLSDERVEKVAESLKKEANDGK